MRKPCDHRGRDWWSDADTSQDTWSSESWRKKLRLDNSDVRIHLSYSKAHAFGQQQYPPETNTENEEKKGRMESSFQITGRADGLTEWITEFFSDNRKSRWIN